MERKQTLTVPQHPLDGHQCTVLSQRLPEWHQRVSLISTFPLPDVVHDPRIVFPKMHGWTPVKHPDTVASGSVSVRAWNACATHSVPASEGALKRRRASLHDGVDLLGTVLPTNLRRMSPATIPLTPPSGFWRAVILPTRMASITTCGTWPLANCSPIQCNMRVSSGWDNRGRARLSCQMALVLHLSWLNESSLRICPV